MIPRYRTSARDEPGCSLSDVLIDTPLSYRSKMLNANDSLQEVELLVSESLRTAKSLNVVKLFFRSPIVPYQCNPG